jgi:hypothetical protein
LNRESSRLRIQLYQTLPPRPKTSHHTIQNHSYKNFFENIFPQAVQDHSGTIRSSILNIFYIEYLSSDLIRLIHYINHRYPRINTLKRQEYYRDITTTSKFVLQRENSKTDLHNIFNLFDPDLRSKAVPPPKPKPLLLPNAKTPITFKRLGTKLSVLAALSRPQISNRSRSSVATTDTK